MSERVRTGAIGRQHFHLEVKLALWLARDGSERSRASGRILLDGDELLVEGAPSARVGEIAYQAGIPLDELVSESSSLEDVFLELTAEKPS